MSNNLLLDSLIDPLAPNTISWMPETLGWKLLMLGFLALNAARVFKILNRFIKRRYRRLAKQQLAKLLNELNKLNEHTERLVWLSALNALVKGVAVYAYPHAGLAPLHGQSWLGVLDKTCHKIDFTEALFIVWQESLYQPNLPDWPLSDLHKLGHQIGIWIDEHDEEAL